MKLDIPEIPTQVDISGAEYQFNQNWMHAPANICVDPGPQFDSNIHSSAAYTDGYTHDTNFISPDSLDQYLAAYGAPVYSLDATTFNTEIMLEDPSYLHVPQPHDMPPHPQYASRAFTHFNS